jgi:hypothetical protein
MLFAQQLVVISGARSGVAQGEAALSVLATFSTGGLTRVTAETRWRIHCMKQY